MVNCSFWARLSSKDKETCDKTEQFDQLLQISNLIQNGDETTIYEETGCKFSCEKFTYEMRPTRPLERDDQMFNYMNYSSNNLFYFEFSFKTGDYMEFKQVRHQMPEPACILFHLT